MNQKNKAEKDKVDIRIYINSLSTSFCPAVNAESTTHWFTTEEVYNAIKSIDPASKITKAQVFQGMIDAGYKFQIRPGASGCNFKWMLKAIL